MVAGGCVRVDAPNLVLAQSLAPEQQRRCECTQEGKNAAYRAIDGPPETHRKAGFSGGEWDDHLARVFR
jgi:hypothetical protein